jgi:beta-ribofuranosylaminobenzene 5'-phosphate synthase
MIRVRTGSRLHFGLFSLPSEIAGPWLNQEGQPTIPRRKFGGVGLMIDKAGIDLSVEIAREWSASGPLSQRALQFGQTYCKATGIRECFSIRVQRAVSEHAGLGTGTQLGLAVARALAEYTEQPARDAVSLARQVGRGLRSGIGVHGFQEGGFLVDGGNASDGTPAPLLIRNLFPMDWRVLLITPHDAPGIHGSRELDAFAELGQRPTNDRATESLCRLLLLGMLPALIERDLTVFGEALYDYNRRSGELFKSAQAGIYSHDRVERVVKRIRAAGIRGVGQSSWGPTVFAISTHDRLAELHGELMGLGEASDQELFLTGPRNHGALLSTEY